MKPHTLPKPVITAFFIIGVVSATLFRSIVIINRYYPRLGRIVWYCAVFGYIFFFGYRFYIAFKRRKTVLKSGLIMKVMESDLQEQEKEELSYILHSLVKSREMYNYIFIFVLSIVAIITDCILEYMIR